MSFNFSKIFKNIDMINTSYLINNNKVINDSVLSINSFREKYAYVFENIFDDARAHVLWKLLVEINEFDKTNLSIEEENVKYSNFPILNIYKNESIRVINKNVIIGDDPINEENSLIINNNVLDLSKHLNDTVEITDSIQPFTSTQTIQSDQCNLINKIIQVNYNSHYIVSSLLTKAIERNSLKYSIKAPNLFVQLNHNKNINMKIKDMASFDQCVQLFKNEIEEMLNRLHITCGVNPQTMMYERFIMLNGDHLKLLDFPKVLVIAKSI